jgi:hypothetical protein
MTTVCNHAIGSNKPYSQPLGTLNIWCPDAAAHWLSAGASAVTAIACLAGPDAGSWRRHQRRLGRLLRKGARRGGGCRRSDPRITTGAWVAHRAGAGVKTEPAWEGLSAHIRCAAHEARASGAMRASSPQCPCPLPPAGGSRPLAGALADCVRRHDDVTTRQLPRPELTAFSSPLTCLYFSRASATLSHSWVTCAAIGFPWGNGPRWWAVPDRTVTWTVGVIIMASLCGRAQHGILLAKLNQS